jgi:MSHA biogenesis protein MshM
MARSEPADYLQHRLRVAGYRGPRMFSAAALWLIQQQTRRTPRLLNIVAHKALLSAYGKGHRSVDAWDVLAATRDTTSLRAHHELGKRGLLLFIFLGGCIAATAWVYQL